jgi:transcriptional antiterminator RfaH
MFWACAQLRPQQTRLALYCLQLEGFTVYVPRLRVRRARRGRDVEVAPLLFPGYAFVAIELQWRAAHYAPGVIRLVQDGQQPARVPDAVIAELKGRERDGLIELPKPRVLRVGDPVRVLRGPFANHLALYDGMQPRDRVAILLALLGGQQRVTLPKGDIEIVPNVS